MKHLRQYIHILILLFGLIYIVYNITNNIVEYINLYIEWDSPNIFLLAIFDFFNNLSIEWFDSGNFYWIFIYALVMIATFPKKMTTQRIQVFLSLAIGFLVGHYMMYIIGYPSEIIRFRMVSYVEPISIILLLIFLMIYKRQSNLMTDKQLFIVKIVFIVLSLSTLIYRVVFWNLVNGETLIYGYSIKGGILILGIFFYAVLNKEAVEVNTSYKSLSLSLFKSLGFAIVVYALYFATRYKLPYVHADWGYLFSIENDFRILFIQMASLLLYIWVILKNIFATFGVFKSRIVLSIVFPTLWTISSVSAILIHLNYWIFTIPVHLITLYGLMLLTSNIKQIIHDQRWETQLKKTIEINQYT